MANNFLAVLLICFVFSTQSQATEWTMHGSLKNESAYFISGEKRWDKIQNKLELKPEAVLANGWEFRSRALLWYDAAMDIQGTRSPDLTHSIKQHYRTTTQLKEAYLLYSADSFDLRLGQQQIIWGKTDALRLLDIINPLDLREFILDDFFDSRIGLVAARLNYYPDTDTEQEIELIIIPDAKPSQTAPTGSRWALNTPTPPAGFTVQTLNNEQPNWSVKNTEYGAAWRGNIEGWDLSANYFYGWKDSSNAFRKITPGIITVQFKHLRMHTVGGSFSNAFGAWVVRGELATNLQEGVNAQGTTFTDTVQRKTTVNAALAAEWTGHNWTVSPQFFIRHIKNWNAKLLEPQNSGFWMLGISTDFMHEKLKPEILLLADWAAGGWLARPKVSYDWSDDVTASIGADIFGGSHGLLGQFNQNDRVSFEVAYSF
ncbi:MAG: hypothetical protein COB41_01685 [Proteobacteria bacterium]|nr:MAG: hypothetical protein COB41_01685 [Pseudomonadota bacterium]